MEDFSFDRLVGLAGLLLGVVSLALAVQAEHYKVAVLVGLLLLVCVGFAIYTKVASHRPSITTLRIEKTLTIHDASGASATLTRKVVFRPNYANVDHIWCRNIVADGTVTNIKIDGADPDAEERLGCLVSVAKRYVGPLQKGQTYELTFTYDLKDSFTTEEEGISHDVCGGTMELCLKVVLPASRCCKTPTAHLGSGGEKQALQQKITTSAMRDQLSLVIKRPKPGYTYYLYWTW